MKSFSLSVEGLSCREKSLKTICSVTLVTELECQIKRNVYLFATLLVIALVEIIYSTEF